MSSGNANTSNNEVINKMREWQATAIAGKIREKEKSGKDYIEHAGSQESAKNPMKTLKEDYDDKKKEWDESNKLFLLMVPLIGWYILFDRYKDQKDAREAWGEKVIEERKSDKSFVENFQQQFDKMTPEQRNQICQIGEQFMNDKGFDMTKFIENNKKLSENDQVLQLKNQLEEMKSEIKPYQAIYQKYASAGASTSAPTMSVAGQNKANANLIIQNKEQQLAEGTIQIDTTNDAALKSVFYGIKQQIGRRQIDSGLLFRISGVQQAMENGKNIVIGCGAERIAVKKDNAGQYQCSII